MVRTPRVCVEEYPVGPSCQKTSFRWHLFCGFSGLATTLPVNLTVKVG
jgi:hypothetical protein